MFQSATVSTRLFEQRGLRLNGRWLGAAVGVWIGLYPFADLALRPRIGAVKTDINTIGVASPALTAAFAAIVASGLVPIFFSALKFDVDFRRAKLFFAAIFLICLAVPLSLFSTGDIATFNYVVLIDYVFVCATLLISTNVDTRELRQSFFTAAGIVMSIAMAMALLDHDFAWGRLMGRTAPNYWGGMASATILATIAMRGRILKLVLIGLSVFMLYNTQSRSVILAMTASLSLTGVLYMRHPNGRRSVWLWLLVALALVAALAFSSGADDILLLSDPRRGLGSGLTGRTDTWREGWDLFAAHPWFGIGYQQDQQYLSSRLAIHNAYLATLADLGIFGLIGYLIFLIGALGRSIGQAWNSPTGVNLASVASLAAFTFGCLFEPSGLHTGNTNSMLAIIIAALVWRTDPADQLPARAAGRRSAAAPNNR